MLTQLVSTIKLALNKHLLILFTDFKAEMKSYDTIYNTMHLSSFCLRLCEYKSDAFPAVCLIITYIQLIMRWSY